MRGPVRSEWDQLREHDVLFLLSIAPPSAATLASWNAADPSTESAPKPHQLYGLTHVRGCEVIEVRRSGVHHPPSLSARVWLAHGSEWKTWSSVNACLI